MSDGPQHTMCIDCLHWKICRKREGKKLRPGGRCVWTPSKFYPKTWHVCPALASQERPQ